MDLNVNNYSSNELLVIFKASEDALTIEKLQNLLFTKIHEVKNTDSNQLPEKKENLTEFFTKCFFKIVNDYKLYDTLKYQDKMEQEFISVNKDLLPKMEKTHIVQQNNSMVEKHADKQPIQTWNSHLKSGIINPLQRKSYKKILNINTRFRDNYESTKSTDFVFTLPYPLKKVVSMKLGCTEFPNTMYTFSSNLSSNYFKIGKPKTECECEEELETIQIPNGSYTIPQLVKTINTKLNELSSLSSFDIYLNYCDITRKMTFISQTRMDFLLNFCYDETNVCPMLSSNIDKNQLTLGWILGFRGSAIHKRYFPAGEFIPKNGMVCLADDYLDPDNTYRGQSKYTGEAMFDERNSKYILLSINDFHNNHNELFISPFKEQSLSDHNILAKISTDNHKQHICEELERVYFGPVDLTKLDIKLYDEFGRLIDVNNSDYSFTIELEILYDL